MTGDKLRKGDEVSWRSHGATVEGEVVEEITENTEAAGRTVRAARTIRSTGCAATTAARTPFTSRAHCESDDRPVTVADAVHP
jgi:ribulose-5-phosphate 4-epimerase/fuculose-1-phosphate aldolase